MDAGELSERIASHPLLQGLAAAEVEVIASHGQALSVTEGERFLKQGEPADELVLVLSGRASVTMRGERGFDHELATVQGGGTLGELGLLGGGTRGATVRALEPTECFVLSVEGFQQMLEARESAAIHVLERLARTVAGRLSTMNARLCSMTEEQEHPDGTVRLSLADIRERLLKAGASGQ